MHLRFPCPCSLSLVFSFLLHTKYAYSSNAHSSYLQKITWKVPTFFLLTSHALITLPIIWTVCPSNYSTSGHLEKHRGRAENNFTKKLHSLQFLNRSQAECTVTSKLAHQISVWVGITGNSKEGEHKIMFLRGPPPVHTKRWALKLSYKKSLLVFTMTNPFSSFHFECCLFSRYVIRYPSKINL